MSTDVRPDPEALPALEQLGGTDLVLRVLDSLADKLQQVPDQLLDAAAAADHAALQTLAHGMLSVSGYAGEEPVRAAAMALERAIRSGAHGDYPALLQRFTDAAAEALPRVERARQRYKANASG